MEALRIEIAQFYEEQRLKQREMAERQALIQTRQSLLEEMDKARKMRAQAEAERREEEDFYKNQVLN